MKTSVLRISKAKKTKKKMNFLKMVKVTQRKTVIFMLMYLKVLTLKIMLNPIVKKIILKIVMVNT